MIAIKENIWKNWRDCKFFMDGKSYLQTQLVHSSFDIVHPSFLAFLSSGFLGLSLNCRSYPQNISTNQDMISLFMRNKKQTIQGCTSDLKSKLQSAVYAMHEKRFFVTNSRSGLDHLIFCETMTETLTCNFLHGIYSSFPSRG